MVMGNELVEVRAEELPGFVPDGATVGLTGSGVFLEPDAILFALEKSFLKTGHPRDLTVIHALGIGDGRISGLNRLAHEGMVRKVIGGHWSWSPRMQSLARNNQLAAYSLPAGVISTLMRESGAGRPGLITKVGLGTFADPRIDGGRCNQRAQEELVELIDIGGTTYLRYKPVRIDVAIVRGSDVDRRGNVSFVREAAELDAAAIALAAHNTGGKVLCQVEKRLGARICPSRLARLPGILVDAIFFAPNQKQSHWPDYDPHISGEAPTDREAQRRQPDLPQGLRRVIAERAMREIGTSCSVNFGFGIPGGIPALLKAAKAATYWGTIEQGIHNGEMLDGNMFGAARDPDSIIPSVDQFDFYSGGGIDIAFLGMGELDASGNVNVSMLNGDLIGPGGFIDIAQTARKVVFCGTFEAKGLRAKIAPDGEVLIRRYGEIPKLTQQVGHITFSGSQARREGQEVLYVTERAVFRLGKERVELIEVAHGIDPQRDVLERMKFEPRVRLP